MKDAYDLVRVDRLWNEPLDWKEKGSSTTTILAHLRQALGKEFKVEMRGQDSNIATFELSQAPLGPTLASVVALADSQLWAFSGRLLVAPEALLTPEEKTLAKSSQGGEWLHSSTAGGMRWSAIERFQFIALTLVGADLKERFAAKGLTPASPPPEHMNWSFLVYELPMSDLSPATQRTLQDLSDAEWERSQANKRLWHPDQPASSEKAPVLAPSTIVGFDDTQNKQLHLVLEIPNPKDAAKRKNLNNWYVSMPPSPLP